MGVVVTIIRMLKVFMINFVSRQIGAEDEDDIIMGEESDEEQEEKPVSLSEQKIIEERTSMIVAHFLFSIVWSIGATLDGSSRLKFDEFFRALCDMEGSTAKYPRLVFSSKVCQKCGVMSYELLFHRLQ